MKKAALYPSRRKAGIAVAVAASLFVSACGGTDSEDGTWTTVPGGETDGETSTAATTETETETTASEGERDGQGHFPVTVESCGEKLTFDKAPSNVVMLGVTGAATMLRLGVEDAIGYRTDDIRPGAFEGKDLETLEAIPKVDAAELDTGGSKVSTEALLDARPDLVLGYDTGVDREALTNAGVPFYSPRVFCSDYKVHHASFDLVMEEIATFGRIFGKKREAGRVKGEVGREIGEIRPADPGKTAAVLYVTPGSTTFYTYGTSSMVQPILEVNGLQNSYAESQERVFDASMEDLLQKNPDWIVLLSDDGTDEAALETFMGFSGAADMDAVKNDRVVVMPFALTDPPSPLSVKGAKVLNDKMAAKK